MKNGSEDWNTYAWTRAEEEGKKDALLHGVEQNMPRPEYASGELKLQYTKNFSTGHVFKIKEDNIGVHIDLKLVDGTDIDITKEPFFPQGILLVTPTYAKAHAITNGWSENGYWYADHQYISVGDMKSAESVFILLHELGHLQPNLNKKMLAIAEDSAEAVINEAKYQSVNERGAWAEALKIVRYLKEKYGVDMMELFPSVEDFHTYMATSMVLHRYEHEFDVKSAYGDFLSDEEIQEELRGFFDKPQNKIISDRFKKAA